MSLDDWEQAGWLRKYETSAKEISNLLSLVGRDLKDSLQEEISLDWRFNIAYNAALQLATLILYSSGYRTGRGESKHYRVIQAISLIMGNQLNPIRDYLDSCRRKRNTSEYDAVGTVSEKEFNDLIRTARDFKIQVIDWLRKNHPDLIE
ncbi:MAG: hypothetical protein JXB26_18500 [Candidatus Aminicenantes bacterium]|nr:hypothetical protein [Candidatus Aminicenantes bacterium]